MKKLLLCLLLALPALAGPPDLRVVAGRTVDLAPLHAWAELPEANRRKQPRPLAHWLAIQLETIGPVVARYHRFTVTFPESRCRRNHAHTETCTGQPRDIWLMEPPKAFLTLSAQYDALRAKYHQYEQAGWWEWNQQTFFRLQNELANLRHRLNVAGSDCAMNTGRKYGGLEIWTCGQRK